MLNYLSQIHLRLLQKEQFKNKQKQLVTWLAINLQIILNKPRERHRRIVRKQLEMKKKLLHLINKYLEKDISSHKWSTTHRVLKSHRSKMSIYILSWKQCTLPVMTTMALWQLMHLGTWCTVTHCSYQRVLNKLSKEHNISSKRYRYIDIHR